MDTAFPFTLAVITMLKLTDDILFECLQSILVAVRFSRPSHKEHHHVDINRHAAVMGSSEA